MAMQKRAYGAQAYLGNMINLWKKTGTDVSSGLLEYHNTPRVYDKTLIKGITIDTKCYTTSDIDFRAYFHKYPKFKKKIFFKFYKRFLKKS